MRRRSVLAGIVTLACGCTRAVSDDPIDVRVMRASDATEASADRTCRLSESFLDDHHVLQRTLESAATAPVGEWVTDDTDRETGEALADDLRDHCEEHGGIYRYDGDPYRIRVVEAESGEPLLAGSVGVGRDGTSSVGRDGTSVVSRDGGGRAGSARTAEFGSD